jgi:hypothetical protein
MQHRAQGPPSHRKEKNVITLHFTTLRAPPEACSAAQSGKSARPGPVDIGGTRPVFWPTQTIKIKQETRKALLEWN